MRRRIEPKLLIALPAFGMFMGLPAQGMDMGGAPSSTHVLSGGVGKGARQELAREAHSYELKLVFVSTPSGSFLADIPVTITDPAGHKLVDQVSQGPWMFVDLPSGSYMVSAELGDRTLTRKISVHQGSQRTVYFRWPESHSAMPMHTAGR